MELVEVVEVVVVARMDVVSGDLGAQFGHTTLSSKTLKEHLAETLSPW